MLEKFIELANANPGLIKRLCDTMGEMPNIPTATMGGKVFWNNIFEVNDWRIQKNIFTGHCRILDPDNIRRAWGTHEAMEKAMTRIIKNIEKLALKNEGNCIIGQTLDKNQVVFGDVIGTCRGAYDHYGVYVNDDEIIHYSGVGSDFSGEMSVHTTTLKKFLNGSENFFNIYFPPKYEKPKKNIINVEYNIGLLRFSVNNGNIVAGNNLLGMISEVFELYKSLNYKLYSPEETVERARLRIGEAKYNLVFNNCEHFAIWCKTGINESHQVNDMLKLITRQSLSY